MAGGEGRAATRRSHSTNKNCGAASLNTHITPQPSSLDEPEKALFCGFQGHCLPVASYGKYAATSLEIARE